jgi:hypothetical protein
MYISNDHTNIEFIQTTPTTTTGEQVNFLNYYMDTKQTKK